MSEPSTDLRRAMKLVLRRDRVVHDHFVAPSVLPVIGAGVSVALMTTKEGDIFLRAGGLLVLGDQPAMDTGVLQAVKRPDPPA